MFAQVGREKEMLALIKAKIEPMTPPPPPGPYACSSSVDDHAPAYKVPHVNSKDKNKKSPTLTSTEEISSIEKTDMDTSINNASEDAKEDNTELERMRGVLDSMLGKLQSRIQVAERALDGKIQLLDADRDGIISSAELKDTMKKILKRYPTDAEAEAFVLLLDEDRDGAGNCGTFSVT